MTSELETPISSPSKSGKSSTTTWIIVGIALVLLCLCCILLAGLGYWLYSSGQLDFLGGGLDPDAAPAGTISLQAGFIPDPYTATTVSGGTLDAASTNLGADCLGFTNSAPNFILNWSGQSNGMSIFFVSETGQDATLLVHAPGGEWYCNDDSGFGGLDPMVTISSPTAGEYAIWVGSLMQENFGNGTLYVTELPFNPTDPDGRGGRDNGTPGGSLDVGAAPTYGETDLRSGFPGDPFTVDITSGGPVDVYDQNLDGGCIGYANSAPDFRLNWTGASDQLDIFFVSDGDTTLIVNDPNGNWYCDDDSDYSYDPQVTIYNPRQGQYDIWVGSYTSGNTFPGMLYITESPDLYNPGTIEGNLPPEPVGELDATLEPTYGETELAAGFSPDPFTLSVISGGELDVWMMNIGAGGYADSAPTYRLYWSGSVEQLSFGFTASGGGDTTMIVMDPSGAYRYNDDSGGTLNPTVRFDDPLPGEYNIWVASYHQGQTRSGTLSITDTPAPRPTASLSPLFGSTTLQAGFSPDPYRVDLSSGGPISVWDTSIYSYGCAGFVTEAPSFRVTYSGSASRLRFFFMSEDMGDTTLLVLTPSGEWMCNDDSGYQDSEGYPYHPLVDLPNPAAGIYNVWVSTLGDPTGHAGTLYITGQDRHPGNTP